VRCRVRPWTVFGSSVILDLDDHRFDAAADEDRSQELMRGAQWLDLQ